MSELDPAAPPLAASSAPAALADGRVRLLCGICVLAVTCVFFVPPVAQDPSYHHFADRAQMFGIQNFRNVVSNLLFVLAGVFGLVTVSRLYDNAIRCHYLLICVGTLLISVGSAHYHRAPSTELLVWDRLSMTVVFMALFAMVVSDRISPALGRRLLAPMLLLGVISVVYWYYSEMDGKGDLRPYALVQFLPMLLIPLMLVLYKGRGLRASWLWATLASYALAKLAEHLDTPIFNALQLISGHSVKHVLSGIGVLFAIIAMHRSEKS